MKRVRAAALLLTIAILVGLSGMIPHARAAGDFADVPQSHWAYEYIAELRERGVTDGVGNNRFGLGRTVTRAEFAAFLCKLMQWPLVTPEKAHFNDVHFNEWYYMYVETAYANGCLVDGANFRPNEPIRRDDMAVMIVRSLGYDKQAAALSGLPAPYTDVTGQKGYIHMATSFGIINGVGNGKFAPERTALREESAAMLIRMVHMLDNEIDFISGFYAIRSAPQMDVIDDLDAVCFGWARLEVNDYTVNLNFTSQNNNEYNRPSGWEEPYYRAADKQRLLFVAVSDATAKAVLDGSDDMRSAVVTMLAHQVRANPGARPPFDGIVMDFEGLKADRKDAYTALLTALRREIGDSLLFVAVHPARRPGVAYYDGYDFRAIGELADRVILMAHDYDPKSLQEADSHPSIRGFLAPLDEVYIALAAITSPDTGVVDKSKVLLQLNFAAAQWKYHVEVDKYLPVNQTPYTPGYDALAARLRAGAQVVIDSTAISPVMLFDDTNDNTFNAVFYENRQSIDAKITLAKRFGIGGLSLWRLGTIPDFEAAIGLDVKQAILNR